MSWLCRIFPPPVKDGREYLFHESAVKVDLNSRDRVLVVCCVKFHRLRRIVLYNI
ncbi:hypothetical protein O5833_27010 [Escherichia coli]|nr:hypothetical protein [Escherichia coli]